MKSRVLVLGGGGMLGHKVWQVCRERFETWVTFRTPPSGAVASLFDSSRVVSGVSAGDLVSLARALAEARPTDVINCTGIVKQRRGARDPVASIAVNAAWPHEIAALCAAAGARPIHISTDCVFSGRRGNYGEADAPDAEDLYGRSKALGELDEIEGLTLRTSMIGRELGGRSGLVEWFLGERGRTVRGYTRAVFSGFTTAALAAILADLIERHPALRGLYHVAASPIDKCTLLRQLNEAFSAGITIEPDDRSVVIDRSLNAERFWAAVGRRSPDWTTMIAALASDPTPYEKYRS